MNIPRFRIKHECLCHYSNSEPPKCVRCGFQDERALTIDHINGGGNKHRISLGLKSAGSAFYKWLKKNNFPPGYQTLCSNCQMIKEAEKRGVIEPITGVILWKKPVG